LHENRRQRLRRLTQAQHQRLDDLVGEPDALADTPRFSHFLSTMLRLHVAAARRLRAAALLGLVHAGSDDAPIAELEADLQALGRARATALVLPPVRCDGGALGLRYVLMGSALGARGIRERAAGQTALRFIDAQARQTRRWPGFLAELEGASLDAAGEAACSRMAACTFTAVATALQSPAVGLCRHRPSLAEPAEA